MRSASFLKTPEGSLAHLLSLCLGYFLFYVLNGVFVKAFTGSSAQGFVGVSSLEYLIYSTAASSLFCVVLIFLLGWHRLKRPPRWAAVIVPSGLCTAIIVPATTLMYLLPVSVMVAMIIMRGAVVIVSRIVDELLKRQGLAHRSVHWSENLALLFALSAVSAKIWVSPGKGDEFDFVHSPLAMGILTAYVLAYGIRIYLMNVFRHRRSLSGEAAPDNRAYFAYEQLVCSLALAVALAFVVIGWPELPASRAVLDPHPAWGAAMASGMPYGVVAFFSVFLFMFKGRSATFNGLVNRLTSLLAGTASTFYLHVHYHLPAPSSEDWLAFALVLGSIACLSISDRFQRSSQKSGTARG